MDEARKIGKLTVVEYHPAFIALGREVHQHPILAETLAGQEIKEFEVFIAEVAAYCNFSMDGIYNEDELVHVAELCLAELQKRRTIHIQ